MRLSYFILIVFQLCLMVQFTIHELEIPSFSIVNYSELPVPYEMTTLETSYTFTIYAVCLVFHFFIVEEIFRRRNGSIIWDKAGLRAAIQIGFTILFYFLYVVIFSDLKTRHNVERELTFYQFCQYRFSITLIFLIPTILCLLLFKIYAFWKNIFILFSIGILFTCIDIYLIHYYQASIVKIPFNDVQEERRLITNIVPIDISIGFILWRDQLRNVRLDNQYQKSQS